MVANGKWVDLCDPCQKVLKMAAGSMPLFGTCEACGGYNKVRQCRDDNAVKAAVQKARANRDKKG